MSSWRRRQMMQMMAGGSPTPPTPIVLQPFSVSASLQVYFSLGNLQWSATGGGASPTTHNTADGLGAEGTWRFAEHQWDIIGSGNNNKSQTYSGWVDLFGYGTSGYNSIFPYLKTNDNNAYPATDITGTYYDWGVYNDIYNPNTQQTDIAGTWRTPTKDEWTYILNTRTTTSGVRYAKATVNGVGGMIVVPDLWAGTLTLNSPNTPTAAYNSNVLTDADWESYEVQGAIFLPQTGYLINASVFFDATSGFYYCVNQLASNLAWNMRLQPSNMTFDYKDKKQGQAVRLVHDVI